MGRRLYLLRVLSWDNCPQLARRAPRYHTYPMATATVTKRRRKPAVPTFELTSFTWTKSQKTLVVEASDLQLNEMPQQFDIHSPKTGKVFRFVFGMPVTDVEGETTGWYYTAASDECPVRLVMVYND